MVSPRFKALDRLGEAQDASKRKQDGMFRRGRLVDVDEDGLARVEVYGRAGQTATIEAFSMLDEPQELIGLFVHLLVPSGNTFQGAWVMGAYGAVTTLADTTELAHAPGVLEARDRFALPDTDAWAGTFTIPAGATVQLTSIRLTARSLTNGVVVLRIGNARFSQVFYDDPVVTLRPVEPLLITAPDTAILSVDMTLSVDRLAAFQTDDAVLEAFSVTGSQPAGQRLRLSTRTGAGLPNMRLRGRLALPAL